ncbi:GNAT family N-acetyltransferase [Streptosporangium sp. NPDC020145]|uniref:GNAT family N-acetyltransferase n=1 Tax=Streptosporangium sp. NPDC020145 TaxID=3154694 RepID=UPI003438DF63
MNVTVRPGTPTDVEALVAFDLVAHDDRARAESITRWCRDGSALVAELGGTPVGYCALEYTFFEQGFVGMLYVAESARRTGIGTALLTAARAACTTRNRNPMASDGGVARSWAVRLRRGVGGVRACRRRPRCSALRAIARA